MEWYSICYLMGWVLLPLGVGSSAGMPEIFVNSPAPHCIAHDQLNAEPSNHSLIPSIEPPLTHSASGLGRLAHAESGTGVMQSAHAAHDPGEEPVSSSFGFDRHPY